MRCKEKVTTVLIGDEPIESYLKSIDKALESGAIVNVRASIAKEEMLNRIEKCFERMRARVDAHEDGLQGHIKYEGSEEKIKVIYCTIQKIPSYNFEKKLEFLKKEDNHDVP